MKTRIISLIMAIIVLTSFAYACEDPDCEISPKKSGWSWYTQWKDLWLFYHFGGSVIIKHNGTPVTGTYAWNATGSLPGFSKDYHCKWFWGGEEKNVTCIWGYTCSEHSSNAGGTFTSNHTF